MDERLFKKQRLLMNDDIQVTIQKAQQAMARMRFEQTYCGVDGTAPDVAYLYDRFQSIVDKRKNMRLKEQV
jgi:hypothetical protein